MKQVLSFASHKRWVLAFQSLPSFATVHFALSLLLMVKRSDRSLCEEKRPLENPGWSKLGCGAGACDLRAFDGQGTQAPLLVSYLDVELLCPCCFASRHGCRSPVRLPVCPLLDANAGLCCSSEGVTHNEFSLVVSIETAKKLSSAVLEGLQAKPSRAPSFLSLFLF